VDHPEKTWDAENASRTGRNETWTNGGSWFAEYVGEKEEEKLKKCRGKTNPH